MILMMIKIFYEFMIYKALFISNKIDFCVIEYKVRTLVAKHRFNTTSVQYVFMGNLIEPHQIGDIGEKHNLNPADV